MKKWVAVSDNRHGNYEIEERILNAIGVELRVLNCATEADMLRDCADADGVLLDMAPMSARVAAGLTRCRVVSRYGVGYDNVDVAACTQRGIQVANVPDYCAEDVSDHAIALLLSALRQTALRDRLIRGGAWNIHAAKSYRIAGKTVGVLGAGRIARAFIRKLQGFEPDRILVYDPYVPGDALASIGARKTELDEVLREADFLSLHMPVTAETRGMINADALSKMKPTAILINTARGPLVDDAALLAALQSGRIAFAGLDTHNTEPLGKDSPFCKLDNVVLTDHTAYNTEEAIVELKTKAAQNVADVLSGRPPRYPVNKLAL